MSRVGNKPIQIPSGVELSQEGRRLSVKGPKGTLDLDVPKNLEVKTEDGQVTLTTNSKDGDKSTKARHGLIRSLIAGAIEGVSQGYSLKLEVVGVGFRAQVSGKTLTLKLGYSHDSVYQLPEGVDAAVDQNTITISGIDKQLVGQVAAEVRKLRPPEPYKGKGIKYSDEYIIRKAGKAAGAAAKE